MDNSVKHQTFFRTTSALALASVLGVAAHAATPEAGSVIGNQATATYVNGAGDTITVTSNKVETVVQQVAGLLLTSDNSEEIAPGGKAFLPHIVTNTGNGADAFALTAVEGAGDYDFASVVIYADADMDGVADNATPITETPVLAAGERFGIVIVTTTPATATAGQTETVTLTATSQLDGTETVTNLDTLTVATGAIMELVKSMSVDKSAGDPTIVDAGDKVTVTLTYSNTGLSASTGYTVSDVIDTRLPYTLSSAQWSDATVAGGLDESNGALVDATNGVGETIAWQADAASNTVEFEISSVAPGRTGSVTFEATIGALAEAGLIENTATQADASGAYPDSNTASVEVDPQYVHVIDDSFTQSDLSVLRSATDDDAANDSVLETTDTAQGGTVVFEFVLGNDSNQDDAYTLDVSNLDFPAGTTFRVVGADGATPIVGEVPLAAGTGTKVTLIATLPVNAAPAAAGTTNYTATIEATSTQSGNVNTSTAEFTGAVLAATVDLTNAVAGSEGTGDNPDNLGAPWVTTTADPGETVIYPLELANQGTTSDNYNLTLDAPLPDGWTYEFQLPDGTVVTNTGTIPAGQSATVNLVITPAEDEVPGTTSFEIVATSPISGQSDSIVDALTVNTVVDLAISADQTTQAAPGGVVDILHTVTNEGNITITEGALSQTGLSQFSGVIYLDQNGDGVLDPTDPVIDNIDDIAGGIAPGDSVQLIYRVQVGPVPGVAETGTISIDTALNSGAATDGDTLDNAVEDQIVVVSGDVTLTKYQAIDPDCDGNPGAFSKERQAVEPNQCIRYRIVAANTGTASVDDVVIKDIVPAYTAYETCGAACDAAVTPATATLDVTGDPLIESSHGALAPGADASLEFTVRVDP
ncbi:Ubp3 associated protein Bre5 [Roseivivax sp. THAF197b]|nr:Ubp3 associated protein Bre5 [Roseivivax sp. THAF197b]